MGKVVGICVALLVLAVGFIVLTQLGEIPALSDAFRSVPPLQQATWNVLVLMLALLAILLIAGLLSYALVQQRNAARALERRLDGVRQGAKDLAKSQVGADAAVHHLVRTDPEDAIGAVQQRLTEAERFAHVQQGRNEMVGLQSRINDIRAQQEALKERLAPMLDKRRSIEQLFIELDTRQNDLDRSLAEIATGDDAVELDNRLKSLMEFIKKNHGRCDEIERASKTIANLKEDFSGLQNRVAPYAAAADGITSRVKQLRTASDSLSMTISSLEQTPDGTLVERVQRFDDEKKKLEDGLSHLTTQFQKLATLRRDIDGLFANFDRALDMLAIEPDEQNAADVDVRIEDLWHFIKDTQAHLDQIEQRMVVFGQLKTKLGELQMRLVPLEAGEGGVATLVDQVRESRDRLIWRITHIEHDDDGDLAERVRKFTETKRELEERVLGLTDQFSKLAMIRKDIAGLFEKVTSAVSASSN
jgi:DNA repair exonuclease SbcCD ATPase subunit